MSSTNKTTNYDLSQFIGSDKPAWLADYNQDMSKIDTQMKANADGVTAANGKADTNTTNIGDMSYLATTAKNTVVAAINEVDSNADTAQNTANNASTIASNAKLVADTLASYLSLTNNGQITPTLTGGTVGDINSLFYALNEAGTLGKIYGRYRFTKTTSGDATITLPIPGLNVSESFTISSGVYFNVIDTSASVFTVVNSSDLTVNTNGTVSFTIGSAARVNDRVTVWLPPCLYFFTDFGDIYNPNV